MEADKRMAETTEDIILELDTHIIHCGENLKKTKRNMASLAFKQILYRARGENQGVLHLYGTKH